jgi:hypothetical protein
MNSKKTLSDALSLVVVFIGLMLAEVINSHKPYHHKMLTNEQVPSNLLIKKFTPTTVLCGECLILGKEDNMIDGQNIYIGQEFSPSAKG